MNLFLFYLQDLLYQSFTDLVPHTARYIASSATLRKLEATWFLRLWRNPKWQYFQFKALQLVSLVWYLILLWPEILVFIHLSRVAMLEFANVFVGKKALCWGILLTAKLSCCWCASHAGRICAGSLIAVWQQQFQSYLQSLWLIKFWSFWSLCIKWPSVDLNVCGRPVLHKLSVFWNLCYL